MWERTRAVAEVLREAGHAYTVHAPHSLNLMDVGTLGLQREALEAMERFRKDDALPLLPVLDDFERALQNSNKDNGDPFIEGIKLIYNKLLSTLSKKGLDEIQANGQFFDTDFHEAISFIPVQDEMQKNKIIEITQKGYKLHGKVVRFAKVVVGV